MWVQLQKDVIYCPSFDITGITMRHNKIIWRKCKSVADECGERIYFCPITSILVQSAEVFMALLNRRTAFD